MNGESFLTGHFFKTALNWPGWPMLQVSGTIYLLYGIPVLIRAASHHTLFHLELQAAIVTHQPFVLAVTIFR
jgi:hypothetical protein